MEQSGAYRCGSQTDFLAHYFRYGYGVHYVRFARPAAYSAVRFLGEAERTFDYFHFLAVVTVEIAVKQILESIFNHFILLRGSEGCRFTVHGELSGFACFDCAVRKRTFYTKLLFFRESCKINPH